MDGCFVAPPSTILGFTTQSKHSALGTADAVGVVEGNLDIDGAAEGGPIDFGGTNVRGVGVGAGVPIMSSADCILGDAEGGGAASTGVGALVGSNVEAEGSTEATCGLTPPSFPPLIPTASPPTTTTTRSTATAAVMR